MQNRGETAVNLYLREIGRVKRLAPRLEAELVARIKKGDRKARERLIKANLSLVVKLAREYQNQGLPLLDLISEGNIGLLKAVKQFYPVSESQPSAYGAWWIKHCIKRALAKQSNILRLPLQETGG